MSRSADHLLLLSQKVDRLRSTSAPNPQHIEGFRAWVKTAEGLPGSREGLLKLLSDDEDLIAFNERDDKVKIGWQQGNTARIVLGVATLFSAILLQMVSDSRLKVLIGVQLLGLIIVLCIPQHL